MSFVSTNPGWLTVGSVHCRTTGRVRPHEYTHLLGIWCRSHALALVILYVVPGHYENPWGPDTISSPCLVSFDAVHSRPSSVNAHHGVRCTRSPGARKLSSISMVVAIQLHGALSQCLFVIA